MKKPSLLIAVAVLCMSAARAQAVDYYWWCARVTPPTLTMQASPGETIYFPTTVKNVSIDPGVYLRFVGGGVGTDFSRSPEPTWVSWAGKPDLNAGETQSFSLWLVDIPLTQANGSYVYDISCEYRILNRNNNTMFTGTGWVPYDSSHLYSFGVSNQKITLIVVPEPSGLVVLICGMGAVALQKRR